MATPEGTQAAPAEQTDKVLESVSDGKSYEERSTAAFKALEAGYSPQAVNKRFTAPIESDDAGTAEGKPEEATGNSDDQTKAKAKTQGEGEKPDPKEKAKPDTDRLEKVLLAKRVLQRDNMTDDDFEALGEDRILALAEKAAVRQRENDKRFVQTRQNPSKAEETVEAKPETATDDFDQVIAELSEIDDEIAPKVKARIDALTKANEEAQKHLRQQRLEVMVSKATLEFPELKDEAELAKVLERAGRLAQSTGYESADEALADACLLQFGARRTRTAQDRLLESSRSERDGQVDTTTVVSDEQQPMTKSEKDSLAYKLLSDGKTPEEARLIVSRIPNAE